MPAADLRGRYQVTAIEAICSRKSIRLPINDQSYTLAQLNAVPAHDAAQALEKCCGSSRWIRLLSDGRPYKSRTTLFATAKRIWFELEPDDWLEAFTHHPRIGDRDSLRTKFENTHQWASQEQLDTATASEEVLESLVTMNRRYEEKFGYIFIVCATGKSAAEMLEILNQRIKNSENEELQIAATEQWKISEIRLNKLLNN